MSDEPARPPRTEDLVPYAQALRTWFAISLQTFGGPAGQISVMHRVLVDEKRWIGEQRFLHALSYCTLLPGPEAQQLAIYTGWLLNGVRGGLAAGILFVLPGCLAMLVLSAIYAGAGDTTVVVSIFDGVAPAVLAIVAQAVVRIGSRALVHPALVTLAVAAFAAIAIFAVPFPFVVIGAGVVGWALGRWWPASMAHLDKTSDHDSGPAPLIPDTALHRERPSRRHLIRVLFAGLVAWAVPVVAVTLLFGRGSVFTQQALFFTATALVSFGGAYAALAYVAQKAVGVYGWVTATEMVRGLALAETTPGPLIMVFQFVAFLGAYRDPGSLNPWVAGVIASLLTTWVTFVPSFVFIFLGAPYVERLRGNRAISSALNGITAAVVGVIANLALFFAIHTLFAETRLATWGPVKVVVPVVSSIKPGAVAISLVAAWLIFGQKWTVLRTLGVCAAIGLAGGLLGLTS